MRRSSALPQSNRSQSVDWAHSAFGTPLMSSEGSNNAATSEEFSSATRVRCTRSLSVSFQGESFFYHMSRAKNSISSAAPTRKHAPEKRRMAAATTATTTTSPTNRTDGSARLENYTPGEHHNHSRQRWSAARSPIQSNPLARSIDFSTLDKQNLVASVKLLPHSFLFNDGTRSSFFAENHVSSDSDSVSTDSNTRTTDSSIHSRSRFSPRGISIPARFLQDANSWHRQSVVESVVPSPGAASSPLRGRIGPSPPYHNVTSPSRSMASPSSMRNGDVSVGSTLAGQPGLAPSIISFAAEVRKAKKGEDRIEQAHLLRLLHNRYLQWRFANARAEAVKVARRLTTEKALYNAWINMTEARGSNTIKRIKLHLLTQNFKLNSLLKGQMAYLEDWSLMERKHSASLLGSVEVLRASILHLPVVGGARADIQDVKEAVGSAVDMIQAMGSSISSICSLLSKAEETSLLVSELCKVVAQEQALLEQAKELLSTVASLHVIQCSLHAQTLAPYRKGVTMHHLR